MAKKRIRVLSVRMTTTDAKYLRRLARVVGCSPSELVRELVHAECRRRGMFEPELPPTDATSPAVAADQNGTH